MLLKFGELNKYHDFFSKVKKLWIETLKLYEREGIKYDGNG